MAAEGIVSCRRLRVPDVSCWVELSNVMILGYVPVRIQFAPRLVLTVVCLTRQHASGPAMWHCRTVRELRPIKIVLHVGVW